MYDHSNFDDIFLYIYYMKHKSVDYKLSAVNYYLNHEDGYDNTCKIFDYKKSSLKRWIQRYKTSKNLTRRNRKPVSYKITKPQILYPKSYDF